MCSAMVVQPSAQREEAMHWLTGAPPPRSTSCSCPSAATGAPRRLPHVSSSNSSPTRQVAPQPRPVPQEAPAPRTGEPTGNVLVAPMPGTILSVDVRVGDPIQAGDHVCTLEAMKMQQSLRAEWTGVISDVFVNPGDQVQDNAPLLAIG